MAAIPGLSSVLIPIEPTYLGAIRSHSINLSEWIISLPFGNPSYAYSTDLTLREVETSTLKKVLRVMITAIFAYLCYKSHPAIFAIAALPKVYNRHNLPKRGLPPSVPPPAHPSNPLPLEKKIFAPLNPLQQVQISCFSALIDFFTHLKDYAAAHHVLNIAPYDLCLQAPLLGIKQLETFVLEGKKKEAKELAEKLTDGIATAEAMKDLLPQIVEHLTKGDLIDSAYELAFKYPTENSRAKFIVVAHHLSKGNHAKAKLFLDGFKRDELEQLMHYLKEKQLYAVALLVGETSKEYYFDDLEKGYFLAKTGQLESARALISKIEVSNTRPFLVLAYAEALIALGENGKALNILTDLLYSFREEDMGTHFSLFQLAQLIFQEKDIDRLKLVVDAAKDNIFSSNIHEYYLNLCKEFKEPHRILEFIQKYLKTNRAHHETFYSYLLETYLALELEGLAKDAQTQMNHTSQSYFLFCQYYAAKGEFDKARESLEHIRARIPLTRAKIALATEMHKKSAKDGLKLSGEILEAILKIPTEA